MPGSGGAAVTSAPAPGSAHSAASTAESDLPPRKRQMVTKEAPPQHTPATSLADVHALFEAAAASVAGAKEAPASNSSSQAVCHPSQIEEQSHTETEKQSTLVNESNIDTSRPMPRLEEGTKNWWRAATPDMARTPSAPPLRWTLVDSVFFVELDSNVISPLRGLLTASNAARDLRRRCCGYNLHSYGGGRHGLPARHAVEIECLCTLLDQEWAVLHRKVRGTGQRPDETKLENLRRWKKWVMFACTQQPAYAESAGMDFPPLVSSATSKCANALSQIAQQPNSKPVLQQTQQQILPQMVAPSQQVFNQPNPMQPSSAVLGPAVVCTQAQSTHSGMAGSNMLPTHHQMTVPTWNSIWRPAAWPNMQVSGDARQGSSFAGVGKIHQSFTPDGILVYKSV